MVRSLFAGLLAVVTLPAMAAGEYTRVDFDDVKRKCSEFIANDQMQPQFATISCNELSYQWRLSKPSLAALPNQRSVGARVVVKRFEVPNRFFAFEVPPTDVQCLNFVKIERKIDNVEVTLSCADLLRIEDLGQFCEPHVSSAAMEDPDLIVERPTSETISVCPNR